MEKITDKTKNKGEIRSISKFVVVNLFDTISSFAIFEILESLLIYFDIYQIKTLTKISLKMF